jgi:hypothetical protein
MPEQLARRLEEGIYQIMAIVPQLLASLGILLAGFAIAKMVERGTDASLRRVGFNRWMRDGGVTEALQRAGTSLDPSTVMAKLTFWTVMVLVILLSANALGLAVVSSLFAELLAYIPHVIAAVIVLVLGIVLGEFVKELVLASAGGVSGGPTLGRAAKGAVIVLAIFMALEQIGIAQDIVLVAFIAVFGAAALAAGIAFGLGGRDVAAEIARDWFERSKRLERRHAVEARRRLAAAEGSREAAPAEARAERAERAERTERTERAEEPAPEPVVTE